MSRTNFILAALVGSAYANYFSGEIKTQERYLYGKFRARIQGTGQKGTVQSLFTFWEGTEELPWSQKEWEEIDIELVPSKVNSTFYTNIIYAW
jgi:endo-1,3-1,4-beta-glycanase ExoK